jgi:hypothetical protein
MTFAVQRRSGEDVLRICSWGGVLLRRGPMCPGIGSEPVSGPAIGTGVAVLWGPISLADRRQGM